MLGVLGVNNVALCSTFCSAELRDVAQNFSSVAERDMHMAVHGSIGSCPWLRVSTSWCGNALLAP